jgi:hypothetical protein
MVTELPGGFPGPEPEVEPPEPPEPPDPPEPAPPSMGTTEYVALGARFCDGGSRCSLRGKDRHVVKKVERKRAARLSCILN